jgi:hypothetical protein
MCRFPYGSGWVQIQGNSLLIFNPIDNSTTTLDIGTDLTKLAFSVGRNAQSSRHVSNITIGQVILGIAVVGLVCSGVGLFVAMGVIATGVVTTGLLTLASIAAIGFAADPMAVYFGIDQVRTYR